MVYELARIEYADALIEDLESELIEPVAARVLDRICAGLEASPNTLEEIVDFYRAAERLRLTS